MQQFRVLVFLLLAFSRSQAWIAPHGSIVARTVDLPQESAAASRKSSPRLAENASKLRLTRQIFPSLRSNGTWHAQKKNVRVRYRWKLFTMIGIAACFLLLPTKAAAVSTEGLAEPLVEPLMAHAAAATQTSSLALAVAAAPISRGTELRLTFRLMYAALLGGAVGKERSGKNHYAGCRTMALTAMGAAAFTVCSMYGFLFFERYDPARMAANVASGVGFIGAGVITTSSNQNSVNVVHGLTTAAAIWLSAAVGVACGVGLYYIATAAATSTICILRFGSIKKQKRQGNAQAESVGQVTLPEVPFEYKNVTGAGTRLRSNSPGGSEEGKLQQEEKLQQERRLKEIENDEGISTFRRKRVDSDVEEVIRSALEDKTKHCMESEDWLPSKASNPYSP